MKCQSYSFIGDSVFSFNGYEFLFIFCVVKYYIIFFFAHPSKMYGSFQLEFLLHVFLLCVLADLTPHLGSF